MKKNSRIVTMAAAALLAVAPVAVSAVPVNASTVNIGGSTDAASKTPQALDVTLTATNLNTLTAGSSVSDINFNLTSSFGRPQASDSAIKVYLVRSSGELGPEVHKIEAGRVYRAVATVSVNNLNNSNTYLVNGSSNGRNPFGGTIDGIQVSSAKFAVVDKNQTGNPYIVEGSTTSNSNSVVSSGSIALEKGQNTIASIIAKITNKYQVSVAGNGTQGYWSDLRSEVESSLRSAGIKVNSDGTFNAPATSFTVTVTGHATNGKTVSFPVSVTAAATPVDYSANPVITYNGKSYNHSQKISLASNASFAHVSLNGQVDTAAIRKAFTAVFSSHITNTSIGVTVDTSKVNTAVAGTYPVTVSATNPNGHTTTLTFDITVGQNSKTVKTADGQPAPIYTINGNTVTQTNQTLANGTQVSTFGTVTINGVSYTRINGQTANQWVETKNVDGSAKPSQDTNTANHTIMVNSKAYDKNGHYLGHMYYAYDDISIVPEVVTINGKTYYKVANKDEYVRVTNITGTKRRLRHNAYIYWSSYRRTPGTGKYYKGQTITTYGGQMRFKNGKKYYRIQGCRNNNKRYIKAVNFYPLG